MNLILWKKFSYSMKCKLKVTIKLLMVLSLRHEIVTLEEGLPAVPRKGHVVHSIYTFAGNQLVK